jgi:hypothetical protein
MTTRIEAAQKQLEKAQNEYMDASRRGDAKSIDAAISKGVKALAKLADLRGGETK